MTSDQAHKALRRSLNAAVRPSAIFAATHGMALGALRAIWEAELALLETISLLAFDDCEWMTALRPFLSTLRQPIDEIAQEAWTVLNERIQGRPIERVNREFPCTLIIRESTAIGEVSPLIPAKPGKQEPATIVQGSAKSRLLNS